MRLQEVTGDDKACVQLLEAVAERDGVAIITGVPCRHGSVADVSRRVLGSGHVNRPFTVTTLLKFSSSYQTVGSLVFSCLQAGKAHQGRASSHVVIKGWGSKRVLTAGPEVNPIPWHPRL